MSKRKIITDFLAEHPGMKSLSAAKILTQKYPLEFTNINSARCAVRYYRGTKGDRDRYYLQKKGDPLPSPPRRPVYTAPETEWVPYMLPDEFKRGVILADLHVPYHDPDAIEAAAVDAHACGHTDFVILNGDIWDAYWLSKFSKSPDQRNPMAEITCLVEMLDYLRARFPNALIVYKEGNHDARWASWIARSDGGVLLEYLSALGWVDDDNPLTLPGLLGLREKCMVYVGEKRPIRLGDHLWVVHGDEWNAGAITINPARTALTRTKRCTIVAHSHIPSSHSEVAIDGSQLVGWSIGCLCALHPRYCRVNNWQLGYALVELIGDSFHVSNRRIDPATKGVWSA